jgi:hypothetical protein
MPSFELIDRISATRPAAPVGQMITLAEQRSVDLPDSQIEQMIARLTSF